MEDADKEMKRIVSQKPKPNESTLHIQKTTVSVRAHIFPLGAVPHLHAVLSKGILVSSAAWRKAAF